MNAKLYLDTKKVTFKAENGKEETFRMCGAKVGDEPCVPLNIGGGVSKNYFKEFDFSVLLGGFTLPD